MRITGTASDASKKFKKKVTEQLNLLALSQLGVSRRRHNAYPTISAGSTRLRSAQIQLATPDGVPAHVQNKFQGKCGELVIDAHWKRSEQTFFFRKLLRLLDPKSILSNSWRQDLTRAAHLAGESQCLTDIAGAFLLNMIAVEILLTGSSDRYSDALPKRAESFLGWAADWKLRNYESRIGAIYRKRCDLVHRGRKDEITKGDLFFSDDLLFNVLINIVRHPRLFRSKELLIEFSSKVQAEKLLGIKSRTRPKTLSLSQPVYSSMDFDDPI